AGDPLDEASCLKREHHLMHRWWRDPEVPLHVGLCWRASIEPSVVVNKRQIFALLSGELRFHACSCRDSSKDHLSEGKPQSLRVKRPACQAGGLCRNHADNWHRHPTLYLFGRASSEQKLLGRVVHKSTGGMLNSSPEPVDLVGNAFRLVCR